jgi:pyruvate/2-oxoglutarate dehydrogenase complex dihydrolipoamide acyltransferase (E2) component
VLAVAAVVLIVGAVLSWFVEAPAPAPPSAPAPAPKAVARPVPKAVEPAPPVDMAAPAVVPQEAPQAEREIAGYRDVRVPGRPLEECMGPDREINPEVLRCRDGYTVREPIYR